MACQEVVNGFRCEKGKSITFTSPYDPGNPLVTHNWTIDGVQESIAAQFEKTYPNLGLHTLVHSGTNACAGGCTQTAQLDIIDVITPPSTTSAPQQSSAALIIAALIAAGLLGVIISKK